MAKEWNNNKNTRWDKDKKPWHKKKQKHATVRVTGLKVWVNDGNAEKALRKLKKKIDNDGKLQTLKSKEYYEKPSIVRKRARDVARKRHLREQADRTPSRNRLY